MIAKLEALRRSSAVLLLLACTQAVCIHPVMLHCQRGQLPLLTILAGMSFPHHLQMAHTHAHARQAQLWKLLALMPFHL